MNLVEQTSTVTIDDGEEKKSAVYNKVHIENEDEIVITYTFVGELSAPSL
ncbi:hypothetical protein [Aneurinibacillus tyrosinisolvens]|nr:hypothetical protein [Aneurinibacillus tyrosinisolvens]